MERLMKMLVAEVWPGLHDRLDMLAGSHIKEKDYLWESTGARGFDRVILLL